MSFYIKNIFLKVYKRLLQQKIRILA